MLIASSYDAVKINIHGSGCGTDSNIHIPRFSKANIANAICGFYKLKMRELPYSYCIQSMYTLHAYYFLANSPIR